MQSDDVNRDSPLDGSTPSSLSRLASALGCTVGDFYSDKPTEAAQLVEVVRLWARLTSDDREHILGLLRVRAMPGKSE